MDLNQDWIELLESLNSNEVDYLIVGAFALAFHGLPRYTGDLDIFVNATNENAARLYAALKDFGAPVDPLNTDTFAEEGTMISFGVPPRAVDILNWVTGITYQEASADAVKGKLGTVQVKFLSRDSLKKNKLATGREKDLRDISELDS